MKRLSDAQIKKLKLKKSEYSMADGHGLRLLIRPNGSKLWQYRYHLKDDDGNRIERKKGLGTYPKISLSQARSQHSLFMNDVANGIDIVLRDKEERKKAKGIIDDIFMDYFYQWLDIKKTKVLPQTWDKDLNRIKRFIEPEFGDMKMKDISTQMLLRKLNQIATAKQSNPRASSRETAMRTLNVVFNVYKYWETISGEKYNPAHGLADYVQGDTTKTQRKAILDKQTMGRYIYTVENNDSSRDLVGCFVRLIPHVLVRHSELLSMEWKQIDFKKKEWTYVISKTKKTGVSDFTVYLTDQAIRILNDAKALTGNKDKVFAGNDKHGQLSQRATLYRIRELGFGKEDTTIHGFRASAMSLGQDELNANDRVIDICLGHATKNPLGVSYDRAQLKKQRIDFMRKWSDFLIESKTEYIKHHKIKLVK